MFCFGGPPCLPPSPPPTHTKEASKIAQPVGDLPSQVLESHPSSPWQDGRQKAELSGAGTPALLEYEEQGIVRSCLNELQNKSQRYNLGERL